MRSAQLGLALVALGLVAGVPACAPKRACVPAEIATSRDLIDLSQPAGAHAPVSPGMIREVSAEFRRRGAAAHPQPGRPYHFLALSGGGLYGSFGAGVLVGWTEAGTRPAFDVVTGISTGSLIATFAFLGPEYDRVLMKYAGGIERKDYLRLRPVARIPFRDAVFSSDPMARSLAAEITPEVLCAVAREHAAGRRLYVGTSNLDTRRLTIWDMGAIAARDPGGPGPVPGRGARFLLGAGGVPAGSDPGRDRRAVVRGAARRRRRERRGDLPVVHGGGPQPRRRPARRVGPARLHPVRDQQRQAVRRPEVHEAADLLDPRRHGPLAALRQDAGRVLPHLPELPGDGGRVPAGVDPPGPAGRGDAGKPGRAAGGPAADRGGRVPDRPRGPGRARAGATCRPAPTPPSRPCPAPGPGS